MVKNIYLLFCIYLNNIFNRNIEVLFKENSIQIVISKKNLIDIVIFLSKNSVLKYNSVVDILCFDNLISKNRFVLNYFFRNLETGSVINIGFQIKDFDFIDSITNLYTGANWIEREVFDFFGIFFYGHNNLRRILTDYGFIGYPLRKDFPLTGYVECSYDELNSEFIYKPIESLIVNSLVFDENIEW